MMGSCRSNPRLVSAYSFLASLTLDEPNAEEDGKKVQTFFAAMETTIKEHPLWANSTHQEIDHALEVNLWKHCGFLSLLFRCCLCLRLALNVSACFVR